ncbi:MAG: addiction module protein [Rhodomicrobium sp.]
MNERVKRLAEQAQQLTHEEQADLFDQLLVMMHESPPPMGKDWEEEIERRVAEADQGEVVLIDFDEAVRSVRAKL